MKGNQSMAQDVLLTLGAILIVATALVVTVSIVFNRSLRFRADDKSFEIETHASKNIGD
jgi:hypothetical protein